MKIAESTVQLFSQHLSIEQHQTRESLTVWKDGSDPGEIRGGRGRKSRGNLLSDFKNFGQEKLSLSGKGVQRRHLNPANQEMTEEQKLNSELNLRLLVALFERLTGRKFQMTDPSQVSPAQNTDIETVIPDAPVEQVEQIAPQEGREGFGLIYDYHESHYEYESTEFKAGGTILTEDGKQIDFSVSLNMSREFYSEQNINIRAGDALKDPLVINFSGNATQLSQRDFYFDIDSDGTKDQISFVGPGSGFLALDKNGDGKINNGTELFGPQSGNGYAELSKYDSDGNNWIDENDAIYESLRIWSINSAGEEQLVALGKVGIGALYLGNVATPFSVKDSDNELLGQVRASGIALMESGQVVTMQQVDLVA